MIKGSPWYDEGQLKFKNKLAVYKLYAGCTTSPD